MEHVKTVFAAIGFGLILVASSMATPPGSEMAETREQCYESARGQYLQCVEGCDERDVGCHNACMRRYEEDLKYCAALE